MDKEKIISNYDGFDEDKRAYGTRAEQIEFTYTKRLLDEYIKPTMSVAELGCGTGYYGYYLSDKCRSYHGVDLVPKHIKQFQDGIRQKGLSHLTASIGDATNLFSVSGGEFDAVLAFGPMYHLPREERKRVIAESARICKPGGIVMFAYINKIGAYLRGCIDSALKESYPNRKANEMVLRQGVDDVMPEIFHFTMPEEICTDAVEGGLTLLRNAGVDFTFNASDINAMSEEKYSTWQEVMDYMFKSESCTGVSSHSVLICRKPELK